MGARGTRLALALAGALLPGVTPAVDIDLRMSAASIYTDNIALTPDNEEGEFVLRADPGIRMLSAGTRYDFYLDYTLETYWFTDQSDTSVFHIGETRLDLALIPERLLLKSLATIDQTVVDPAGTVSFGNLPLTGNRTDAVRYETAPEWHQDILGSELVASYRIGHLDYDDDTLQDVDYRFVDATLTSPDVNRGLGWAVRYEHETYSYDLPPDLKRQLAELTLSWTLAGGWTPFGAIGAESDVLDRTDASFEDTLWRVGVRRSSLRSQMEVYGGERSFGSWFGALFELRGADQPANLVRLSYDESPIVDEGFDEIRTFGDLGFFDPFDPLDPSGPADPAAPPEPGDPFFFEDPTLPPGTIGPGTRQIYTRKAAQIMISRVMGRTDVALIGFYEVNEDILRIDQPDVTRESEETGASLRVVYRAGSRTRLTGDLLVTRRDFDAEGPASADDRIMRARAGLRYALGRRTDLDFWIGHQQQDGSASNDYRENQIGIAAAMTF